MNMVEYGCLRGTCLGHSDLERFERTEANLNFPSSLEKNSPDSQEKEGFIRTPPNRYAVMAQVLPSSPNVVPGNFVELQDSGEGKWRRRKYRRIPKREGN